MTPTQRTQLIEYLAGSAHTLSHAMELLGIEGDEAEVEAAIADEVFLCAVCDWWCAADEEGSSNSGERVCRECAGDD